MRNDLRGPPLYLEAPGIVTKALLSLTSSHVTEPAWSLHNKFLQKRGDSATVRSGFHVRCNHQRPRLPPQFQPTSHLADSPPQCLWLPSVTGSSTVALTLALLPWL